uniref:3CxxC-type domain-containing protein n=1 Tax=Ficedula albicollis TaxID=59894 RepID=U3JYB1_FICAL
MTCCLFPSSRPPCQAVVPGIYLHGLPGAKPALSRSFSNSRPVIICGAMSTWQSVFAVKMEEMHITDPWTLLEDDGLQVQACRPGWKEFVQRRALGRFQCSQCFHMWSSAKVHILFHICHCQGWGTVQMRIFRQKCRRCPNSRLEDPEFSLETIETILHNLVLKILQYFYKKPVQRCDLLEVVVDTPVTGPHDCAHCEACQLGICSSPRSAPALDAWKPLTSAFPNSSPHPSGAGWFN